MKYVSIDLETTGLDPETCQIIEFAAVADDLTQPIEKAKTFQTYVLHETYTGEPYALGMHAEIFKKISDWKQEINKDIPVCLVSNLMWNFYMFLMNKADYSPWEDRKIKINVAGKNFNSFDKPFLQRIPNFDHQIHMHRRVLDPAVLYFESSDEVLPDTKTCMERAGIEGKVAHTALEDAMMVVKLLRNKLI